MSNLFELAQPKGKWHKFPSFNLGGGAKLYKNFAQKLLSVSLCMAVVLLGTPLTTLAAGEEPTTFITSAYANHWGRSDLRAYLNGVEKVDNTLPIDTTTSGSNATGYASHFSDAEYDLVQPFTYSTNVLNSRDVAASTYSTTDRFWLPSGNYHSDRVLSWGAADVSRDSDYSGNFDSAHAIPVSYWPAGAFFYSWLRSPGYRGGNGALGAFRGYCVDSTRVDGHDAAAAAFKLDLSSVIFASAALAASLVPAGAKSGSRRFDIQGSSNFDKDVVTALPDYGMFLKQTSDESFEATGLSYSGDQLTVNYSGGVAGQYVVVQAFKQFSDDAETGDLVAGTTSYEAAYQLAAANVGDNKSIELHVSNWGLDSLDGYTLKVWMEDASGGSSLAAATEPVTFVGSGGSITKTETGAATNQRVFAMKNDLQTSWGDLQALKASNETAYNNVIAGNGQDGSEGGSTNSIHGLNPTNQKIYFGTKDGAPLEFWIAGRETYAAGKSPKDGDGEISADGEIMTLYQAKSVETKQFNAIDSNYDGNKKSVTLQLADEQTAEYTGSAVAYPTDKVTAKVVDSSSGSPVETDIPFNNLRWQHRAQGATAWRDGMPSGAGTYQLRCYVPGVTDSYERTYSSVVTFTINKKSITGATITIDPSTMVYTGKKLKPKITSVTVDGITVPSDAYTLEVSGEKQAGETVTVTLTATTSGNFKDFANTTFTITKAAPNSEKLNGNPTLTATYGQTLGDIKEGLASAIGSVLGVDRTALKGVWAWENDDAIKVGNVGAHTFTALFKPTDTNNYDWTTLDGWNDTLGALAVDVAVAVAQATPDDSELNPSLTATYGQTLGDIRSSLATTIGSFLGVDSTALKGVWAWEKADATKVGNVGAHTFTALFAPEDTNNYDWTTLDGWDADKEALVVDVAVNVSVDTSKWGDAQKRDADGKTQYVDSSGKTSIEISEENLSANDILWLFEESYGKSAWYGIDLSTGAFDLDKGLRFYVQWLSPTDPEYNTYYSQLDDAQKARVEGDNGWIFLIGVEDPDGNKVQPAQPAKVYVQLGDPNEGADWDLAHLKAYYITSGGDENVPVEDVPNFAYPGGTDEFGMMTLSHFSPYFIFDELTDEEKAALELKPEDGNNHPTDKPDSSGTDLPGTGDISTELLVSGLAIVLVSSLGVMLRLITNKKKFEE